MLDGVVTDKLFLHWCEELTPEQWSGFLVINDAWRGTKEMEATGLQLDTAYHTRLLDWWTLKRDTGGAVSPEVDAACGAGELAL